MTMQPREKISITMTPEMLREVRTAVQNGEFASTGEALRDAVRVWHRQRLDHAERLETIRGRLRRSIEDARADVDESDVEKRLNDLHAEMIGASNGAKT